MTDDEIAKKILANDILYVDACIKSDGKIYMNKRCPACGKKHRIPMGEFILETSFDSFISMICPNTGVKIFGVLID